MPQLSFFDFENIRCPLLYYHIKNFIADLFCGKAKKMKNKKILSVILAVVTVLTCSSNIVSAEETTEASTETVTEAASEITTEIPTETTAPVTTDTQEEITSVTTRTFILFEPGPNPECWTEGEFKKPLTFDFYKYGDFLGLYMRDMLVDSEYYTAEYDGEKNITFTFNEKFREKYGNGTYLFTLEFESASLRNMFRFVITDPEKQTQTESPKTGDNNVTLLTVLLGLSGIAACIFNRRDTGSRRVSQLK